MRHNSPRVQVGPGRKPSEIRPSVSLSACRLLEFTAKAAEMRAHRTATAAPPHSSPSYERLLTVAVIQSMQISPSQAR